MGSQWLAETLSSGESGGRWSINTGNGYYGGLQFSYSTWLSVGGADFASRADLASRVHPGAFASTAGLLDRMIEGLAGSTVRRVVLASSGYMFGRAGIGRGTIIEFVAGEPIESLDDFGRRNKIGDRW